ncbi:MAG: SpoIID/LytB domain-containing protein, partial [Candidatus Theseobacter exili]|nr:SpoIID/LytB domain-containing protein [Candidatus Theseobacter exili]
MRKVLFIIFFFTIVLCFGTQESHSFGKKPGTQIRRVRVLLVENKPTITIRVRGNYALRNTSSGKLFTKPDSSSLIFSKGKDGIDVSELQTGLKSVSVITGRIGAIVYKKNPIRGTVKIILNRNGTLSMINFIRLEEYLLGVIAPEIGKGAPFEAMKVQAVCARTYALYQMGIREKAPYDVASDHRSQNYGGVRQESTLIALAVQKTRGEYLSYRDRVLPSFYCTSCGGHTENIRNV